jgi:hypothetical protein
MSLVGKIFSAKLSLEARLVLFAVIGYKEKKGRNITLSALSLMPFERTKLADALAELSKCKYIKSATDGFIANEARLDRPEASESLPGWATTDRSGATPVKSLLAHWKSLYRKYAKCKYIKVPSDFSDMHRLRRRVSGKTILRKMDNFFLRNKPEYWKVKTFCANTINSIEKVECSICGRTIPHSHCEVCGSIRHTTSKCPKR